MQLNRVGIGLLLFFGLFGAGFIVVPFAVGADAQIASIFALIGVIWVLVTIGLIAYAMKLELDLDIPGVGMRRVSRREVMPVFAANRMRPGLVLPAYADPADPGDFVLVW